MRIESLIRFAVRMADEHAEEVLLSECFLYPGGLCSIPPKAERSVDLNKALAYLRARSMLERAAQDSQLWRVRRSPITWGAMLGQLGPLPHSNS